MNDGQGTGTMTHTQRIAIQNLAHRTAKVRNLTHEETCKLLTDMESGTVVVDPKDIDREVEQFLTTVRCHEECKSWVREYGYASYKGPHLCEVCALPMRCKNPDGKHTWRAVSPRECNRRGIYHGGHVSECSGCGHISSVDSSD